jgi:hypothetical protein
VRSGWDVVLGIPIVAKSVSAFVEDSLVAVHVRNLPDRYHSTVPDARIRLPNRSTPGS